MYNLERQYGAMLYTSGLSLDLARLIVQKGNAYQK